MTRDLETELAAHGVWLRRLALAMVQHAAQADDLVQETWLSALSHRPRADRPLRPWLARVLRNAARMRHRADERRRRREDAAVEGEPHRSPEELVSALQTQRRLTELVLALEEPYREALLLRYVEDLSAAEIARRLDIPAGTVRWRLKTALEKIRGALGESDAQRRRELRSLVPIAFPLAQGALAVKRKYAVLAAILFLLAAAGFLGLLSLDNEESAASAPGTKAPGGASHPAGASAAAGDDSPRTGARLPPRPAPALRADVTADPDAAGGSIAGRVINWSTGEGVPGAEMTLEHEGRALSIRTEEAGRFHFDAPAPGAYRLAALTAEGFLPFAPDWDDSSVRMVARPGARLSGLTLYLRPAVEYRGRVVSPGGEPVGGAEVVILPSWRSEQRLHTIADQFRSGADGRFVFHAPDGAVLEASHPDYATGRGVLDGDAQVSHELTIRMRPRGAGANLGGESIAGRVIDAGGAPVAGARVRALAPIAAPEPETHTDDRGRFELAGLDPVEYRLLAGAPGYATARRPPALPGGKEVELVLTGAPAVRGRVVDAGGAPVPAFSILVLERSGPLEERVLATRTFLDPDGRFRLADLAPGDYRLAAVAAGHAPSEERRLAVPKPPRAAPEVELALRAGGAITGKVVDRKTGAPLAWARINLEGRRGGGATAAFASATARTDESGAFELTGVPPGLHSILVAAYDHHPRILSGLAVEPGAEHGPLTIDLAPTAEGEEPQLELAGIGAVLGAAKDGLLIREVIDGGGAAEAGLGPGDVIVEVDGAAVTELGFKGTVERIRGVEGTAVRLTIRRKDGTTAELDVMRRRIRA